MNNVTPTPGGGRIAFHSYRDGNAEIYVMNADGTGQARLTNNAALDQTPAWSPDGTRMAFASTRDGGDEQIYVMNADGTAQTRITNAAAKDFEPAWSPDGAKIAFARAGGPTASCEIYVMNADGTSVTQLTPTHTPHCNGEPAWSPDGTKIAFTSNRDGVCTPFSCSHRSFEIYVMNADGTAPTRLTNNATADHAPAWSPDGTKIAFSSNRDGESNTEIYVMNADGTGQTNLTNNAAVDHVAAWSPDGTKIAFGSNRDVLGFFEIFVMNADGSGPANLTNNAALDHTPSWGRDAAPTSKEQCKNGGWQAFGFKNQGQCVRFVETGKSS